MNIKLSIILLLSFLFSHQLFSQLRKIPAAPEYDNLQFWAAHPDKDSPALAVPGDGIASQEDLLDVDIFYIHPTSYTGKEKKTWNADLNDQFLNELTDGYVLKNQASVFNVVGEIYAPRYRQAHISAYGLKNMAMKKEVFDIAYQDVESAFQYYIKMYNLGKPFIIACHSQGTTHGKRLIKEVIDNNPELKSRLVVAYLVGMDVRKDEFQNLGPCSSQDDTGCFTSWRTIRKGKDAPDYYPSGEDYVATNPLTWEEDVKVGERHLHLGAIFKNFKKIRYYSTDTESKDGFLYASRPKFPFSFLFKRSNYHILDYNLFYFNIQQNALDRTKSYLSDL